ncbi:hypothetical protein ACFY40_29390 [Streptomyces sp. NPDC012950]|uniref:hypothetical protein n=1 Tax=Streptomyces sp. NPDC012950 TaxID=3364858 RepID=UPI0036B4DB04
MVPRSWVEQLPDGQIDGYLSGLLRTTTSLPGRRDAARPRVPRPAPERDAYAGNIQTADLDALNANLAVIRWKRSLGISADATDEAHTTYSLSPLRAATDRVTGQRPSTARGSRAVEEGVRRIN